MTSPSSRSFQANAHPTVSLFVFVEKHHARVFKHPLYRK